MITIASAPLPLGRGHKLIVRDSEQGTGYVQLVRATESMDDAIQKIAAQAQERSVGWADVTALEKNGRFMSEENSTLF